MVNSKKLLAVLFVLLVLCTAASAKAKKKSGFKASKAQTQTEATEGTDEAENSDDLLNENENPEEGWQQLEWEEDYPEYVLKYEVIIEERKGDSENFTEIRKIMTEGNTPNARIDPLLPPGFYRYKIITYNLIGIPEIESDWFEFNIYQAYQPQVRSIEININHSSTVYLDEINDGHFTITGRNLFDLQDGPSDTSFSKYILINEKRKNAETIFPHILEISDNNRRLLVEVDMNQIDTGNYYFIAQDASGLRNELNKDSMLTVKFRKAVDFDLAAGYACPVILIGERMSEYLGSRVMPVTTTAKASLLPFKRRFGYLGIGVTASFSRFFADTEGYKIDGNFASGFGLFVYQLPIRFKDKKNTDKLRHVATLEIHGGGGLVMFQDTKFHFTRDLVSETLNSLDLSIIAGGSIQVYITNRLYVEAGADFIMPFIANIAMGYLQPCACVGWQF